ncbi:MAG: A/G-specific adenine glycosylase [Cytophagales bacterium]|nr:A/G-specific adenine glycosylase [Cytophagales bacterium]
MKHTNITQKLISWYKKNKRDLPWRNTRDPYKIWLSEVILQQTRVEQGLPYYLKFVDKYADVTDLASASEIDVLRTWQGLGYYSRARNLHRCAKIIVEKYHGKFPASRGELQKLPGIGPYTSAAISSLAFGRKEAVVDGNVIRVITRLFGVKEDISNQKTISGIDQIANELIPDSTPDQFNQAIMEFGARQCIPKNPHCETCTLRGYCSARKSGIQNEIPFKSQKPKKRTRYFDYLLFMIDDKFLLRERIENDIWKGLFEFVLIEKNDDISLDRVSLPEAMIRQTGNWIISEESKKYKHVLSHQIIICKFYKIRTTKKFVFNPMDWKDYKLYSKEEIEDLPKSVLIDRYLEEELFD